MSAPAILVRTGEVARLVLNRPAKKNALTQEMWQLLPRLLMEAAEDRSVKLLLVEGAGGCFSAGADIAEFETAYSTREKTAAYAADIAAATDGLAAFPKPTIAVIRGVCVGGGLGVALACDLRFCADDSRLGVTPAKLGIIYPLGDTKRLVQAVGPSAAKDLLYSGRLMDAAEALAKGLADRVVPAAELDAVVEEYAATLCANSQWTHRISKRMVGLILSGQTVESRETRDMFLDAVEAPDFQEGRRAFVGKRKPAFPWS
ncbi:enoyl-CoA hydratase/isomerase family protein [Indioceanicola profundi]|uniref:enoyl-CoA hydratase/isomerase family protein n=1 Tax=Indioceanicola profundi TaxID=2220096 RepID=UPI000E6A9A2F|nr:enoyl-CoA hydratase-related protein [Indioceanicola profundi]